MCDERLIDLEARRSEKYHKENEKLIEKLKKLWGKKKEVERKDVRKYLNKVAKGSHWVANKELRFIRALFNYGMNEYLIDYNPTDRLPFYPIERKIKDIPPHEDISKVLDTAKPEDKDYLLVIAYTLGRVNEVDKLEWSDIRADHLILKTRKSRNSDIVERKIPLIKPLKEVIERIPKKGKYLFINPKTGTKYVYRKRLLKGLCKKAKVKEFNYHALRHYGASRLAKEKVPLTDIQALLGHQNASTTDIYLQSLGFVSQMDSLSKLEF